MCWIFSKKFWITLSNNNGICNTNEDVSKIMWKIIKDYLDLTKYPKKIAWSFIAYYYDKNTWKYVKTSQNLSTNTKEILYHNFTNSFASFTPSFWWKNIWQKNFWTFIWINYWKDNNSNWTKYNWNYFDFFSFWSTKDPTRFRIILIPYSTISFPVALEKWTLNKIILPEINFSLAYTHILTNVNNYSKYVWYLLSMIYDTKNRKLVWNFWNDLNVSYKKSFISNKLKENNLSFASVKRLLTTETDFSNSYN